MQQVSNLLTNPYSSLILTQQSEFMVQSGQAWGLSTFVGDVIVEDPS